MNLSHGGAVGLADGEVLDSLIHLIHVLVNRWSLSFLLVCPLGLSDVCPHLITTPERDDNVPQWYLDLLIHLAFLGLTSPEEVC